MSEFQGKVAEFHKAFGLPHGERKFAPSEEEIRLRARLIVEETTEVLAEMFPGPDWDEWLEDARSMIESHRPIMGMADLAHELADLHYVVSGTAVQFGFDEGPVFDEVHRANMAKVGGKVDERGKLQKPEGWTPADVRGVLRAQGWDY